MKKPSLTLWGKKIRWGAVTKSRRQAIYSQFDHLGFVVATQPDLSFDWIADPMKLYSFSFNRPLLEYGDVIWETCSPYEKFELDKIQMKLLEKILSSHD